MVYKGGLDMEYIEPKEFLKQPKKVQESFRNWWKPEIHDLFFRSFENNPNSFLNGIYIGHIGDNETKGNAIRDKSFLPLLTEGQLRKYIEDKTISFDIAKNGYLSTIGLDCTLNNLKTEPLKTESYEFENTDLLKAYFKLACKIAEEE